MRGALLVWLVVVVAVAGLAAAERPRLPSAVIFPKQQLPLSFSHAQHLALDIGCGYCHEDAARSRRAVDVNLPGEAVCATCHEIDRAQPEKAVPAGEPDARCDACHPGWNGAGSPPRLIIPAPNLKFNHQAHAQRGMKCIDCHGDLLKQGVGLATRAQLPRMSSCLACHDGEQAAAACTTCHQSDRDGRVRTVYPEGKLIPSGTLRGDAHDLRFRTEHARVASNDERYCASCHVRSFCLDCHDGVVKPLDFHVGDYVRLHAADARRASLDCGACHRRQTFCTGCHSRTGVGDDPKTSAFERPSETNPTPASRFHPPGWVADSGGFRVLRSANDHSFQAQRNITACASCHREDFCKDCHQGTNPHPSAFAGSARCRALASRNGRVCLRCHTDLEDDRLRCESMR
jgi:c(7)-type cytochrome triheme protein